MNVEDIIPNVKLLSLPIEQYKEVVNIRKSLKLDLDDAYQYSIAKYYGLRVVTMDKDFEKVKEVEILFSCPVLCLNPIQFRCARTGS